MSSQGTIQKQGEHLLMWTPISFPNRLLLLWIHPGTNDGFTRNSWISAGGITEVLSIITPH